jgi:hypothetical protein
MWTMQLPPPRVPRAAQLAYSASQGPRVLPGRYTARLTRGGEVVETTFTVGLDRRAPWILADRKAQLAAAMDAHALFGAMSALVDRLDGAREAARARAAALKGDPLGARLGALADQLDEIKKLVVATKEGGAITGEERIREHLDQVYGAITGWEGRPAAYQTARVAALRRELGDVDAAFGALVAGEIKALRPELEKRKLAPIPTDSKAADLGPRLRGGDAALLSIGLHCLGGEVAACAHAAKEEFHERD